MLRNLWLGIAASTLAVAAGPSAHAQTGPAKPVPAIVPVAPGGGTDMQARLLAKAFHDSMGQTFVIENRAGASGIIGAELAARSPADGSTILFTTASLAVNVTLYG